MLYTTNQIDIVNHAKMCYLKYPTIVNNIPKDTNEYDSTLHDYAIMDNALAGSQRDIGESSNLAQLCQTYSATYGDKKYDNYVAILSVIAQASIDSAKRRFDINIPEEILLIKKDMNINEYGYPKFWKSIRRDLDNAKINKDLKCPMNYLQELKMGRVKPPGCKSIDFKEFLEDHDEKVNYRVIRKVEELIKKFALDLYIDLMQDSKIICDYEYESYFVLRSDFDELISDIRKMNFSGKYRDFVIKIIKRSFLMGSGYKSAKKKMAPTFNKNRSILMKTLYDVNPELFMSCFKKSV